MQRAAPAPASTSETRGRRALADVVAHLGRRRRLIVALAFVVGLTAAWRATRTAADRGSPSASLAAALGEDGLVVDPATVLWLREDGGPIAARPALVLGHHDGELDDVWYVEAHVGRDGAVLDARWLTNVTRTSSAAEESLTRAGDHALYAARVGDLVTAFTVLDLRGEGDEATRDWPLRARLQDDVTNVQETGRREGFGRVRYDLREPAGDLGVRAEHGHFVVVAGGARIELDPERAEPLAGAERVEQRPNEKSQPGGITWVVDTVRGISWVGPAPIELAEHFFYGLKDSVVREQHRLFGDDRRAAAHDAAGALASGTPHAATHVHVAAGAEQEDIGWPPAALAPVLGEPLEGEGRWVAVDDDATVARFPGAPAPFYQTFLRADRERPYTQLFVTVWDPRQLQLHVAMGTREPESATGETGTGLVPRDAETLSGLVAAFNGGFQALHGEFGMMADGRVYLPPKPFAATVAVFDDGRVGMGSWPAVPLDEEGHYSEQLATAAVPEGVVAFRQNLTSVVEGDRVNPWQRWWWGAAPEWASDQTFTARSGLCVTREGFLAYFWGDPMGPDALGAAMLATRCVRGMHLDMNTKHTGMELYRLAAPGTSLPPVAGALGDDAWQGPLDAFDTGVTGWTVRVHKAVRSMDPLRFPRWTRRDARDFFYLTRKPILPGPDAGGVRFESGGLPQPAWPPAFARAELPGGTATVTRIDAARAMPAPVAAAAPAGGARHVLGWLTHARAHVRGPVALLATRGALGQRYSVGAVVPGATVIVAGAPLAAGAHAGAAIGVDASGFLVYAEGDDAASALHAAGVSDAVALPDDVRLVLSGEDDVDADDSVALYAEDRPAASVIFPDVQPTPYSVWGDIQDSRVRYVPEHHPFRFIRTADQRREDPMGAGTPGTPGTP